MKVLERILLVAILVLFSVAAFRGYKMVEIGPDKRSLLEFVLPTLVGGFCFIWYKGVRKLSPFGWRITGVAIGVFFLGGFFSLIQLLVNNERGLVVVGPILSVFLTTVVLGGIMIKLWYPKKYLFFKNGGRKNDP